MEVATQGEAQAAIDANGGCVCRKDVQHGVFVTHEDVCHDLRDEHSGVAAASGVRVRADGAYLGIAGHVQSLTGHCDECPGFEDSEEAAECVGLRLERARLCESRQGDHEWGVFVVELA